MNAHLKGPDPLTIAILLSGISSKCALWTWTGNCLSPLSTTEKQYEKITKTARKVDKIWIVPTKTLRT